MQEDTFFTNKSLSQGVVLIPTLFNFFIDNLIIFLNTNSKCLAFAEDIVIITENKGKLLKQINIIENW